MSKFDYGFEGGKLILKIDTNEDKENSIKLEININEAIQEAVSRETAVTGAKLADFSFEGSKLNLKIDTDKDSEILMELEIDLIEAFDEIKSLVI